MSETELVERLERLERAHRRLKSFALAALVLATALTAIYATQPVPQKITAHQFEVVDDSGKVRVSMGIALGEPSVALSDAQGKWRAEMGIGPSGGPSICFTDAEGEPRASMGTSRSGAPEIWLSDGQGFEMDLGSTKTRTPRTGQTQQTSAASIVMFRNDKEHHVIWQAP
jgi:hypothetical protein